MYKCDFMILTSFSVLLLVGLYLKNRRVFSPPKFCKVISCTELYPVIKKKIRPSMISACASLVLYKSQIKIIKSMFVYPAIMHMCGNFERIQKRVQCVMINSLSLKSHFIFLNNKIKKRHQ